MYVYFSTKPLTKRGRRRTTTKRQKRRSIAHKLTPSLPYSHQLERCKTTRPPKLPRMDPRRTSPPPHPMPNLSSPPLAPPRPRKPWRQLRNPSAGADELTFFVGARDPDHVLAE